MAFSFFVYYYQIKVRHNPKLVIENYNYPGQLGAGAVVPMIHFETRKNWYAEPRYNYEDIRTISFFGDKTFKGENFFE